MYANQLLEKFSVQFFGWHPDNFSFTKAPLSTRPEAAKWAVAYLAIVLGGQAFMKAAVSKPISFKYIFFLHNALLSLGSAILLLLMVENVAPMLGNGFMWAICHEEAWTTRLEFLYYINYLFKYYELIDTMFLVLKKKPLEFLHVYHHAATMILCYFELEGKTAVSWVPIVLNLFVHVIMYYYYARTAVSKKSIWWKKHLTTLQITQFVIDIFAIYLATYTYASSDLFAGSLPNFGLGKCRGAPIAAWIGCAIITSYLGLFVQFFIKTYSDKKRAASAKRAADAFAGKINEQEKAAQAVRKEGSPVRRARAKRTD
ncbi:hypothetical protein HK104_004155 [Borealophlyctis nickersoniae]|nr:hypothetical protein HK104_004155 [Borealophlyctis nickersoniae]